MSRLMARLRRRSRIRYWYVVEFVNGTSYCSVDGEVIASCLERFPHFWSDVLRYYCTWQVGMPEVVASMAVSV